MNVFVVVNTDSDIFGKLTQKIPYSSLFQPKMLQHVSHYLTLDRTEWLVGRGGRVKRQAFPPIGLI
jgi:hypothetical protein